MTPSDSIIDLTRRLVAIPSRAGIDAYDPIVALARRWLRDNKVPSKLLRQGKHTVGLAAIVEGAQDGPVYMLNATLDTAGFGDESRWTEPPTAAHVRRGWMYGRGTADSKGGAALFCHLLARFAQRRKSLRGTLVLLLDLDEHTGGFAGVRTYFDNAQGLPRPQGVFIGYPGNERIVVGSRGFTRATIAVHGHSAHSGGASSRGVNAVTRAAQLTLRLAELPLVQARRSPDFPLPPQLTVTAIEGGAGFSTVPDLCRVLVDVRLTPGFTTAAARRAIVGLVRDFDAHEDRSDACPATRIEWQAGWPAYRVADTHPMVRALRGAAQRELGRDVPPAVVGPSNIGNHLKTLRVPALAGFGVNYRGIHAVDECIELASIAPVYQAYAATLDELFES